MEQTVAFSGLLDLISFLGSFVATPIWFGLTFIQLLVIVFVAHYIIGLCLGGIAPRVSFTRDFSYDRVSYAQFKVTSDDLHPLVVTNDYTRSLLKQ